MHFYSGVMWPDFCLLISCFRLEFAQGSHCGTTNLCMYTPYVSFIKSFSHMLSRHLVSCGQIIMVEKSITGRSGKKNTFICLTGFNSCRKAKGVKLTMRFSITIKNITFWDVCSCFLWQFFVKCNAKILLLTSTQSPVYSFSWQSIFLQGHLSCEGGDGVSLDAYWCVKTSWK